MKVEGATLTQSRPAEGQETQTVPDPLKTPAAPCQVCGAIVPAGKGVRIGRPDGPRVCQQELVRPLDELATLLTRSSTAPLAVG